jgi:hypothetical protein
MGDSLYASRLRWYGYTGCAKLHGRHTVLTSPPVICGQAVVAIDYIPEVGLRQIQRLGGAMGDMTPAEVAEADAVLRGVGNFSPI